MADRNSSRQSAPQPDRQWLDSIKPKHDISTPVSRQELQRTEQKLRDEIKQLRQSQQGGNQGGTFGKVVRNLGRGINDISRSLNNPDAPGARPRIAQMPIGKTKPPIATTGGLDRLRDPRFRGQRIGGPGWANRNKEV
jgi:hypothetical protein